MEKISIQNGDFSILNGENYQWSLFFKKKVQNASEKNEWRNLHFKWRKFPVDNFWKKVRNASEKHLNGEISIQNGDFSILNGENSLLRFFSKKGSKRF